MSRYITYRITLYSIQYIAPKDVARPGADNNHNDNNDNNDNDNNTSTNSDNNM